MNRLDITDLTKQYTKKAPPALQEFSYSFADGVYGLLGPNGAGKSTLINLIVGNLSPNKGEILYEGKQIRELGSSYRSIIGYMPQQQQLYESFTIKRFLFYFAALKGLDKAEAGERIRSLLEVVGLTDAAGKRLGSLSGGMKQRVLIAQALLNDPKILILDEPTAGLDPKERMNIRNFIYSIAQDKTILLATHVISDIELIARELIFLREGKQLLCGTPDQVIDAVREEIWEAEIDKNEYSEINRKYAQNRIIGEREGKVLLKIIAKEKPLCGVVRPAAVSLEDVYLYLYP
ncbi:MAG: ATP-binding cassette domain-containing protein [Lachnospiraceae bacterium]|nr:ATP-binding cassette domain-containing protein [Lachnospiraceae bacterium]